MRESKGKTQSETREKGSKMTKKIEKKIENQNQTKLKKKNEKIESNSSLLEIGPSSAAEERIWVVSKNGCYMFS